MTPRLLGHRYDALGTVHGGVLATSPTIRWALHPLPRRNRLHHAGLTITFPRPVSIDTSRIRCEATPVHVGRRTAHATAAIADPAGRLLAHATTTCPIFPACGRQPARTSHHAAHVSPTA
ncbi:PaaI family thioesterase [Streptomyces lincolnensis]|uniref:PaaI family thioesterase n=1 Tax=Streptomyces lincolnensis TaxID=1915 RepID=UPI001E312E89|nr:PaaI family thioesterase [Streptomyces lincolnensis]